MTIQTIKCNKCGTDNPSIYRFCGDCGTPLFRPPQSAAPTPYSQQPTRTSSENKNFTPTLPVVAANVLQGEIFYTPPKLAQPELFGAIQRWIIQQSFWPQELTAERLAQNVRVVYLAHWLVSGTGEANWSASIGHNRENLEFCGHCGGDGFTTRHRSNYEIYYSDSCKSEVSELCSVCKGKGMWKKTWTDWFDKSGRAQVSIERLVVENLSISLSIKCGKRSSSATLQPLTDSNLVVFQPETLDIAKGTSIAKEAVQRELQRQARSLAQKAGDRYRNLKIEYRKENLKVRTWLYPIFQSEYSFEGEMRAVQVDGVTGEAYAEIPSSVSSKRAILTLGIIVAITIIVLIVVALSSTPK